MSLGIGLVLISFLIIITTGVIFLIVRNKNLKIKEDEISKLKVKLAQNGYNCDNLLYVNKNLSLLMNKSCDKFYIIKEFETEEILIQFVKNFELTKNTIILNYYKSGEVKNIVITPLNNEIKDYIYKVFSNSCKRKICEKLSDKKFLLFSSSDYNCSYFWAYSNFKNTFAYLKLDETIKKPINFLVRNYNLLKENFTIDVKYNYFEAPIDGIAQQLLIYDDNFLSELFNLLLTSIKEKYSCVFADMIYYNPLNNIVYLTNARNSLLSLRLDEVFEVQYFPNKISFELNDGERMIDFFAGNDFIAEFGDFVAGYNLRKLATSFNYSTDKLINTTHNTKFIVDFSRLRVIYCANLNTFSRFSYMIFSFNEIINVKLEKNSNNIFVRIFLADNQIIDISCIKYEIAEYLAALIRKIMDKNY